MIIPGYANYKKNTLIFELLQMLQICRLLLVGRLFGVLRAIFCELFFLQFAKYDFEFFI